MPTPKQRIRSAINRLALTQPMVSRVTPRFARAGDPTSCCFCDHPIMEGDHYRKASTIRAHETCFKAVAEEYKNA